MALDSWTAHPGAERHLGCILDRLMHRAPAAQRFATVLLERCSVRLRDIIDHITLPPANHGVAGWIPTAPGVWRAPDIGFPDIIDRNEFSIAVRVEDVDQVLRTLGSDARIDGAAHGPFRVARLFEEGGLSLYVVERHGWTSLDIPVPSWRQIRRARIHQQILRTRRRHFRDVDSGFRQTERLVLAAVADLGAAWACDLFMRAEREYWMSRCAAGIIQKRRQDSAGVGWCNVDHHVFCASREHIHRINAILRLLGYSRFELVYAGERMGIAALVFTGDRATPTAVVELDLASYELGSVTLEHPLSPLTWRRRADLWCAMHGESMLEGGISRLAGLFDGVALRQQLEREHITMTSPNLRSPYLRQQLTPGEHHAVNPTHVDTLERAGYLSREEAETVRFTGAAATHLQSVERIEGFTGFETPAIDEGYAALSYRGQLVEPKPVRRRRVRRSRARGMA